MARSSLSLSLSLSLCFALLCSGVRATLSLSLSLLLALGPGPAPKRPPPYNVREGRGIGGSHSLSLSVFLALSLSQRLKSSIRDALQKQQAKPETPMPRPRKPNKILELTAGRIRPLHDQGYLILYIIYFILYIIYYILFSKRALKTGTGGCTVIIRATLRVSQKLWRHMRTHDMT